MNNNNNNTIKTVNPPHECVVRMTGGNGNAPRQDARKVRVFVPGRRVRRDRMRRRRGNNEPVLGELDPPRFRPQNRPVDVPPPRRGAPAPVVARRGINMNVGYNANVAARARIERLFPGFDIRYNERGTMHPHPCLALGRTIAERIILNKIRGSVSRARPILDVGLGLRNVGRAEFHGCECSKAPNILAKLKDMAKNNRATLIGIMDPVLGLPTYRTVNDRYTYCTHNAINCACDQDPAINFSYALFTHSIYYNSLPEVAQILLRVQERTGYVVYHEFDGEYGAFHKVEGKYEAEWRRKVIDGEPFIVMSVMGNTHKYHHRPADWLNRPTHLVTTPDGVEYVISVKEITCETSGITRIARLDIFPAGDCDISPYVDVSALRPYELDREIQLASYIPNKFKRSIFRVSTSVISHNTSGAMFPTEMANRLTRYIADKPLDKTTWKMCLKHVSSLANHKLYSDLPECINSNSLVRAMPYVVIYAFSEKLKTTRVLKEALSPKHWFSRKRHNLVIGGRYPFPIIWTVFYILLVLAVQVLGHLFLKDLLRASMSVPVIIYDLGLTNVVTLGVVFAYYGSCSWIFYLLIGWVSSQPYGPQTCTHLPDFSEVADQASEGLLFYLGVVVTSLAYVFLAYLVYRVAVFFFSLFSRRSRDETYDPWDRWKIGYIASRSSAIVTCPIRPVDPLPGLETLVDPDKYPARPRATLKVLRRTESLPKPALVAVGIVFADAVPLVHSNSQKNYIAAVRSRVMFDVGEPQELPWIYHGIMVQGCLPLMEGLHGPEPINKVNKLGAVWRAPTFTDWYCRFPPEKRKKIDEMLEKLSTGDIKPRHDFAYNGFIKREKIVAVKPGPFEPIRPRVIQGCSLAEKVLTGLWFYTYSKAMKHVWHREHHIWACGGATSDDYNAWFDYQTTRLGGVGNCVFIGTDFSKYDLTQGEFCKKREHQWYRDLGFGRIDFAKDILHAREKLKLYGSDTVCKYQYRRQSGSNDTSCGNDKTTGECIEGAMRYFGLSPDEYAMAIQGDDNFLIVTKNAFQLKIKSVQLLESYAQNLGFKLTVMISDHPTMTEFLSCRFYPVLDGYAIGKKPGRVLAKMGWMLYKPNRTQEVWRSLLKASLLSYKHTGLHVPFLRVYLRVLYENLKDVDALFEDPTLQYRLKGDKLYVVTAETWYAFERLYGLDREDERDFEKLLRSQQPPYMFSCPMIEKMYAVDSEM